MVPTLRAIMNSSYYYECRENINLGARLTPARAVSPGFYPLLGVGLLLGAGGATNKGNAIGAEGIFGNARREWATALQPDPF